MPKAVYQANDGRTFPTLAAARGYEATQAVAKVVTDYMPEIDDEFLTTTQVAAIAAFLINNRPEINFAVDLFEKRHDPVIELNEVRNWVILQLVDYIRGDEELTRSRIDRMFDRVWEHLKQDHNDTNGSYSDAECEICTRAWKQFKE